MTMTMIDQFNAARIRGVPILAIRTADQAATIEKVTAAAGEFAVVQWDAARGITPITSLSTEITKRGEAMLRKAEVTADDTIGFVEAMSAAQRFPQGTILFALNAHRQIASMEPSACAAHIQALSNLRDTFKKNFRMVVPLGPDFVAPPELAHDIVIIEDPLPPPTDLERIVTELHQAAKLPIPKGDAMTRAVDAVRGLSTFEAEQVVAMSLQENGLDVDALWERKRVTIEQTRGLSVHRGTERFSDVIGLDAAKEGLLARINAKRPIGVVVVIDEGSDVFANVEHDSSGVKMDQQRALLTEMQNNEWPGAVYTGVPGSGKSLLGKAFGNEAGVPTIFLDFGDMEGPHVGESEAMLRQAIRVIKAVGGGHAFFILTCNSLQGIRPQFQRRFRKGVYFFDVLTQDQQAPVWKHFIKKYELPKQPLPDHDGWMPAEIRECCEEAWDTGKTLVQASRQILPVSRSRAAEMDQMRREAHGRFLDAMHSGMYKYEAAPMERQVRAIALPTAAVVALESMKES